MDEKKVKVIKMPSAIVTSILWIVLGAILLIFPGESLDFLCRIVGIIVLVAGIAQFIIGRMGAATMPVQMASISGILIALIGLFIIIRPDILVSVLPFVAGIILIVHGITSLVNSFSLISSKYGYWWVGIILSVLGIILGFVLFLNAHAAAALTARIVGICMLYAGISHLWVASKKAKARKNSNQTSEPIDVEATVVDIDEE